MEGEPPTVITNCGCSSSWVTIAPWVPGHLYCNKGQDTTRKSPVEYASKGNMQGAEECRENVTFYVRRDRTIHINYVYKLYT